MGVQHGEQQLGSPPGPCPFPIARGEAAYGWASVETLGMWEMIREQSPISASKGDLCGGVGECNFFFQVFHKSVFCIAQGQPHKPESPAHCPTASKNTSWWRMRRADASW